MELVALFFMFIQWCDVHNLMASSHSRQHICLLEYTLTCKIRTAIRAFCSRPMSHIGNKILFVLACSVLKSLVKTAKAKCLELVPNDEAPLLHFHLRPPTQPLRLPTMMNELKCLHVNLLTRHQMDIFHVNLRPEKRERRYRLFLVPS